MVKFPQKLTLSQFLCKGTIFWRVRVVAIRGELQDGNDAERLLLESRIVLPKLESMREPRSAQPDSPARAVSIN